MSVISESSERFLAGKVAIVTGAGSGIGRATALELGKRGALVVMNDLDPRKLHEARDEVESAGAECMPVVADVTKPGQVADMVERAIAHAQRIDILVNNAGATFGEHRSSSFEQEDDILLDQILDLNLKAAMYCARDIIPRMIARRDGVIVNISSSVALLGDARFVVYSAAKGGLISFTRSLARALASHRVRVNCIVPGTIATGILSPEELADRI